MHATLAANWHAVSLSIAHALSLPLHKRTKQIANAILYIRAAVCIVYLEDTQIAMQQQVLRLLKYVGICIEVRCKRGRTPQCSTTKQ